MPSFEITWMLPPSSRYCFSMLMEFSEIRATTSAAPTTWKIEALAFARGSQLVDEFPRMETSSLEIRINARQDTEKGWSRPLCPPYFCGSILFVQDR